MPPPPLAAKRPPHPRQPIPEYPDQPRDDVAQLVGGCAWGQCELVPFSIAESVSGLFAQNPATRTGLVGVSAWDRKQTSESS